MLLKIPDLDILKTILMGGIVPQEIYSESCQAGFDSKGILWLNLSVTVPKKVQDEWKKFGVELVTQEEEIQFSTISCWLEMLPLSPNSESPNLVPNTQVLFDLPSGSHLSKMATEILRLGNDKQSFRFLEDGDTTRGLLRVTNPPYYSLLRAIDSNDDTKAYLENSKDVWIQLGHSHSLGKEIKAPKDQILLISHPRKWTYIPNKPFKDIYEIMEFSLPEKETHWKEEEVEKKITVKMALIPSSSEEPAEMWVLKKNPVEELNHFVQTYDDYLLNRLSFAVGEVKGKKNIILKVRPSKFEPPVVMIDGLPFRHYLKLPNLFVPNGLGIHPPLRRDKIRDLFAKDSNTLSWLYPTENGKFEVESISLDSFKPLPEWVDYVVENERVELQGWISCSIFEFEHFVCSEQEQKEKKPPVEKEERKHKGSKTQIKELLEVPSIKIPVKKIKVEELDDFASIQKVEPSANQIRLRELEDKFSSLEGSLDIPERQDLWPELAALNSALSNIEDAGICWANALWRKETSTSNWAWKWYSVESKTKDPQQELPEKVLDKILATKDNQYSEVRSLATYLIWASSRNPYPSSVIQRLGAIQRFLEANENLLNIRTSWLTWIAFSELSNGDILSLARARDRLLERLFNGGFRPEQDLPTFLRFSGQPSGQRFRAIRQWMNDLCKMAHDWSKDSSNNPSGASGSNTPTQAYIDLIFAYGLARMGEKDAAKELLEKSKKALDTSDPAHQFILEAYDYRIKLARENKKNTGPLPPEQMEFLEKTMDRMPRYLVDRLRQHSKILEPDQNIDPYRAWSAKIGDLDKELSDIAEIQDKKEIQSRIKKVLGDQAKGSKGQEGRSKILPKALDLAPRVGEEFTLELLSELLPHYDSLPDAKEVAGIFEQAALLEKGLLVAAHFDRKDYIQGIVSRFQKLLKSQKGNSSSLQALNSLAGDWFCGLRKLGMREEIDAVLKSIQDCVLDGKEISSLSEKDKNLSMVLRTLLHVASGWFYFGKDRQAEPILNLARELLLKGDSLGKDKTLLATTYAYVCGQAPVEIAQKRLEELFTKLQGVKDSYTTNSHYSLSQLDIVESVILAIVNDDYVMGSDARKWLDNDEFIVRKKVHRDFQAMKAKYNA